MKALFIGGTGTISRAITELAVQKGFELYVINRGIRSDSLPKEVKVMKGDINNEEEIKSIVSGKDFDVVCDFIAFDYKALERDYRLFAGKTRQFIFISTASAYHKPLLSPFITESTPLYNPYWEYSQKKIEAEMFLMNIYREKQFPVTIIRPSHTYGKESIPVAIHGRNGSFSVLERIRTGRPVIVHGDGTSLWTLTHNSDFAKAFVGIMGNAHAIGETYQITSDESLTWNQIYDIIGGVLNTKPNIVHIPSEVLEKSFTPAKGGLLGDKANSVLFDNRKIKTAVPGFVAETRFDQGARETIEFIYSHDRCQRLDPEFDVWADKMIDAYNKMIEAMPIIDC